MWNDKKWCNGCKKSKCHYEFAKNSSKHDGLQSQCKSCKNDYGRQSYYSQNRKPRIQELSQQYRLENEKRIVEHLKSNPCPCGQTNILTLDFDHLRDKDFDVMVGLTNGYSWERLKKEIDKCQVLCSNCHRIKTATQLSTWRLKWLASSDSNRDSIV